MFSIEFFISWENVKNDKKWVPFDQMVYTDLISEFGYGKILIYQNNKCIFLKKVDLLGFAINFEENLRLALKTNDELWITSMYEYYRLSIIKKGKICTITTYNINDTFQLDIDFDSLFKKVKTFKQHLFLEFVDFYPELQLLLNFDEMKSKFGL
ncbi:hypothetical protein [Xanthocytophaga agilis]|uniref:Uncharacterized protein n=1 Tax=Xanthocytophaga agilis TaxID=3048010 RepID=A0AAE3UFB0_9BACT|nr:hypothetical protein [Xanthocytophaga agilis]MDJ1501167.1 hypothetical protein [Xanthocytophaga agilis]